VKRYPRSGLFDLNRTEGIRLGKGRLQAALTGGPGRQARVREAVPVVRAVRSESDGGDQTGEGTATGGAAPLCGGEVTGVEAGVS
jgi:hypothetical protein